MACKYQNAVNCRSVLRDLKYARSTVASVWSSEPVRAVADATMAVTPRMVPFTLVGTLAYLGLAILGWGGLAAFFSHPALIALAILTFVMSGVALFSGGNLSPGIREDRSNRWVIGAFAFIGLLTGFLPAYTDRIGFWTWRYHSVGWRPSLRCRWRASDLAGLCA